MKRKNNNIIHILEPLPKRFKIDIYNYLNIITLNDFIPLIIKRLKISHSNDCNCNNSEVISPYYLDIY